MENFKPVYPIKENMDNSLTEEQCDALFKYIKEAVNSDQPLKKYVNPLKESSPVTEAVDPEVVGSLVALGGSAVLLTIAAITKWIKNKYRLTVSKMLDQSKELNDLYVKVNDILKHDKMARFKHRNDKIDYEAHYIIMKDTRDPRKDYNIMIDFLAYDPEFFIKEINDIMKYVDTYSKDKTKDLQSMKAALMQKIDDNFQEHSYIEFCEPMMKIATYKSQRLEDVLVSCKNTISNIYSYLYAYNKYIGAELQYMQMLQQGYNKMLSTYANNKEGKEMVDEVFKKLLKNVTMSMDFNNKSMTILDGMIKYYVEALTKIYDTIRS